jgi:sugar transferase (PEP-CTERM/EpsH1 system associated)
VTQIYNGVDIERFHPKGNGGREILPSGFVLGDSLIFGAVGRMAAVKDYPTLIRAFAQVVEKYPQARLILVGDGVEYPACKRLTESLGVADKTWMPGERRDIPELMRAMDVFILPSLNEGISNTILEAMASGLPVVATRAGGNVELVREDETGMLTPVGDAESLARRLLKYAGQKELIALHGKTARQTVEQRFSLETMAKAYADVYERALNKNPKEQIHHVRHHRTF